MDRNRRGYRHLRSAGRIFSLASAAGIAMATAFSGGSVSAANANGPVPNTAAGFNNLLDRGNLIFNHYDGRQSSLTFKAVYKASTTDTGASENGGDCTQSWKTLTIEQNGSDNLAYWPKCAEAISTPSTLYVCSWGKGIECGAEKGNHTNPFWSVLEQDLSPYSEASTIESATGGSSLPQGTYSHATIAGQPSECLTTTQFRFCVTDAGLLALFQNNASAASAAGEPSERLALSSYRSSAPDKDFRPPANASIKTR
jgi:hypothetical protein